MPRNFDSDDIARSDTPLLRFTENVECGCGEVFESDFVDDSMTVEDIVDPPRGRHTCPACGRQWASEMTGWTFYSEAG